MGLCSHEKDVQGSKPGAAAAAKPPPPSDPYEVIKVPKLPDLSRYPQELQVFREQCAAGVRQAVAMVTAMEHQLWWERARRQQAEEDVKVLLAAVEAERGMAGTALQETAAQLKQAREEASGGQLVLRANELPAASQAATVIQKNYRGHAARKDFEDHLANVLRGIDPDLDPTNLPASAQHHISGVNVSPGAKGLRATMQGMKVVDPPGMLACAPAAQKLRKEVEAIQKRMDGATDAGHYAADAALDTNLDIKRILSGSLPASNAAVIAALVRRCKDLQSALIEVSESLQQTKAAEQGLRATNTKVLELSQVRAELEEERSHNFELQQVVGKLRHAITAQAAAANASTASVNPHIAAWYRHQYAGGDFLQYVPNKAGVAPGARVWAGPEAEVELWDDLKPSLPDPILIPKHTVEQYSDLLALNGNLQQGVRPTYPDPLYSSPVPDMTQFKYQRDTPILPVASPAPLIRESLPPNTYMDVHKSYQAAPGPGPAAPVYSAPTLAQHPHPYPQQATPPHVQPTPGYAPPPPHAPSYPLVVPVYSVLPLIQENAHIQARYNSSGGALSSPRAPQTPPPGIPFDYQRDTPQMSMNTPLGLLRDGRQPAQQPYNSSPSVGGAPPLPPSTTNPYYNPPSDNFSFQAPSTPAAAHRVSGQPAQSFGSPVQQPPPSPIRSSLLQR